MARNRGQRRALRKRRPGYVSLGDRFRRLPNSVLLYVSFALAVGAAVLATVPFEVPSTRPVPVGEAQRLEAEAATSTTGAVTTIVLTDDTAGRGTTTTTLLLGLEVQPTVTDGAVECASPIFELTVPASDERVARNDDCIQGALFRVILAGVGALTAFLVGMVGRRLRLRRYEAIEKEERRLLRERLRRAREAEAGDEPQVEIVSRSAPNP